LQFAYYNVIIRILNNAFVIESGLLRPLSIFVFWACKGKQGEEKSEKIGVL